MASIQIISDIHLEHYDDTVTMSDILTVTGDYIALLGDIGYPTHNNYKNLIKECSENFKLVFVITGNHEYYCTKNSDLSMTDVDTMVTELVKEYDNVIFLNNDAYILDDNTVILGSTLWSYIHRNDYKMVEQCMNDYNYIYNNGKQISAKDTANLHVKNLEWLIGQLDKYQDKQIIVLTHHTPSYKAIAAKYIGFPANCAFANRLDYLFEKNLNIKYWFYGHTHSSKEFKICLSTCASNPRGYKQYESYENGAFDKEKVYLI